MEYIIYQAQNRVEWLEKENMLKTVTVFHQLL